MLERLARVGHVGELGKAVQQTGVDGGCGFAMELLVDDGFGEGLKRALFWRNAQLKGADAGDELGEFGVSGGECSEGCGCVVWRSLSAGGVRAGHGEDDTAGCDRMKAWS